MASSDNVASIESWAFRPTTFADSWISEAFARDTKTLTRALQKSLSNNPSESLDSDLFLPFLNNVVNPPETASTPTVSGLSGSDPETPAAPKRQRNLIPVSGGGGKASKRKSRASKRSQTTFITADPANFRQMVQQVTGVRFGSGQVHVPSVLKPEPQRPGSRLPGNGGCLPTLDTSAFLLDHHQQHQQHQQQQMVGPPSTTAGPNMPGSGPLCFGGSVDVADCGGVGVSAGGLGFDSFSSFPTLESWKVM